MAYQTQPSRFLAHPAFQIFVMCLILSPSGGRPSSASLSPAADHPTSRWRGG
jgi:hypothetical protein